VPIWKEPLNKGRSWCVLAALVKLKLSSALAGPPQHVGVGLKPIDSFSQVGQLGYGCGQQPTCLVWRGGGCLGCRSFDLQIIQGLVGGQRGLIMLVDSVRTMVPVTCGQFGHS